MAPIHRIQIQGAGHEQTFVEPPQLLPWTEEETQYLIEYSRLFLARFATNLAILSIMLSLLVLVMLAALAITRRLKTFFFGIRKPTATITITEKGLRADDGICPVHTGFCAIMQEAALEATHPTATSAKQEVGGNPIELDGAAQREAERGSRPGHASCWHGSNQLNTSWAMMM